MDYLDNYDGENYMPENEGFMPNEGSFKPKNLRTRNKFNSNKKLGLNGMATINITVRNNSNNKERFELFNALNSIAYQPNDAQYSKVSAGSTNPFQPLSTGKLAQYFIQNSVYQSAGGVLNLIDTTNLASNIAFFDDGSGNLIYLRQYTGGDINIGNPNTISNIAVDGVSGSIVPVRTFEKANSVLTSATPLYVECEDVPYRRLLQSLTSMILHVHKIRIQTNDASNFSNSMEVVEFNDFGAVQTNSRNPLSDLSPNQFQTDIVDFNTNILVDKNVALYQNIEANSYMKMTFFVEAFRDAGAIWDI